MFQSADPISLALFCLLVASLSCLYLFAAKRTKVTALWLGSFALLSIAVSLLAITGVAAAYPIPTLPLFMILMFVWAFSFVFSESGTRLSEQTPLHWLVGFQALRFPLELILHHWASIGTVPGTMTWTGSNIDIVAGVIALVFIPLVKAKEKLAWIPQVIGFVLILNVLRVVVMSSPFPFSWVLDPPLLLAMHFPYALIVTLCVLPAFVGHLLVFRKLVNPAK